MEIDLGNTIVGVVAIILCALPFIIIRKSRKKRENLFKESIFKIASQNNCQISQYEICGNFIIGVDEIKKNILFYKQTKDMEIKQFVNLNEIKSCNIINTNRTFNNKQGNQNAIDRLELSFTPTVKGSPEVKIEFFNSDLNMQLYGELQCIEKWENLIKTHLKNQ